jgi:hypothetical protein
MVSKSTLVSVLLMFLALAAPILVGAQISSLNAAENTINNAYQATLKAYNSGINTDQYIEQLNQALNLTSQAQRIAETDPQQAEILSNQAQFLAENVTQQANDAVQPVSLTLPIITAIIILGLIVGGVLIYVFGPRAIWRIWFNLRKNNHVKLGRSTGNDKTLIITAQQVCGAILAIIIVISVFSVYQTFFPQPNREQFSEFGILGSNMKLGDYPSQVVASDPVNLYVYVGNRMSVPMMYTVMVKLGDNTTTTDPVSAPAIQQYQQVLAINQTWIYPVNVTLTQPGENLRIIFELWYYNETQSQTQYLGLWGQIWLNVTAPAI